jgi:hypothetical protein
MKTVMRANGIKRVDVSVKNTSKQIVVHEISKNLDGNGYDWENRQIGS